MAQHADRLRLGRAVLAEGLVRPRTADGARTGGRGGDEAHRRGRRRQDRHPPARGGDAAGARQRHAEGEIPAPQPDRRGHLVPVVQRAGLRVRPRRRHDAGRVQGQPLGDQRAEGVDDERASCRLGPAAGAHRLGRAEASGAVVFRARHPPAGRRGAPAAADERACVVQPGVLHRCRGAAGDAGLGGRPRLGGGDDDADARAARRGRHAHLGDGVRPAGADL